MAALPRVPARGRKWEYFRSVNPGSDGSHTRAPSAPPSSSRAITPAVAGAGFHTYELK
ncbi:hypothetical protein [Streptomyces caeruleatus]|nr:hypothetical protein [Streptomyces caeruleatus]